jgi:hypothetical protein
MSPHWFSLRRSHKSSDLSKRRPYVYSPLQASSKKIRLLTLLPGPFGTDIHCQLHKTDLHRNSPPLYEALSYAWGSEEDLVVIQIGKGTLSVRKNLADALQHLRYPDRPRTLWIDAICVNQQDLDERSQQVQRMAGIYIRAQCVVVWLGSEAEDSSWALRTLNRIGSMIDPDWSDNSMKPSDEARAAGELHWADRNAFMPYINRELDPVHRLLERAWFERLWIRQEIGLATNAVLMCGAEDIPWSRFRNAIFYLDIKAINNSRVVDDYLKFWDRVRMAYVLCDQSPRFSLRQQIERTKVCECADPRDRIYAVLSISVPQEGVKIIVDYRKSTEEVYQDVVLQHFKRRLFMLTDCEMQNPLSGRPSWAPNWAIRCLTDPLPLIRAGGNSDSKVKHMGGNVLQVIGVIVTGIKTVECITFSKSEEAEVITAIQRLAPPGVDLNSEHGIDIYCQTLICDEFSDYYDPPFGSYLKFEACHEALRSLLGMDRQSSLAVQRREFLSYAFMNMHDRSFFWTEDGRMGLGPGLARATDKIVVLPGCPAPMILRPSHNGNGRYRVVGECFIHDLMNGEALLGPLPEGYQPIRKLDRTDGVYYEAYQDNRTGNIQDEDPRFCLLQSEVREDGVRRVYPTGFPRNIGDKGYTGLKTWTKRFIGEGEEVEVMRNDLQPFLLE